MSDYTSAEPSSPWSRDSIHRFDNLADRARPGKGKYIPKPPREEKGESHLGPGLHNIPSTYELKLSCPSFAGNVSKTAAGTLGATTRKLSSPKTEFADTPACYDIPSMFAPKGTNVSPRNGSASFLSTGRNNVTLGFENRARQDNNNKHKHNQGTSVLDIGASSYDQNNSMNGSGISRSKIFIKTQGRSLRPDGSGDLACLGPGRHHTPAIFLRGQLTATRKNWPQNQNKPIPPSMHEQHEEQFLQNSFDNMSFQSQYSISRSSNSSFTTLNAAMNDGQDHHKQGGGGHSIGGGEKDSILESKREQEKQQANFAKYHVRPNQAQAQAQAAVDLAVKIAAMAASSRVRPNTAPAQLRSTSSSSSPPLSSSQNLPLTSTTSSSSTTGMSSNNNKKTDIGFKAISSSKICLSPLSQSKSKPTSSSSSSLASTQQKHKLKKVKAKKSGYKKETAQSLLEAEISTVRLLPLEGLLGPAYQ